MSFRFLFISLSLVSDDIYTTKFYSGLRMLIVKINKKLLKQEVELLCSLLNNIPFGTQINPEFRLLMENMVFRTV